MIVLSEILAWLTRLRRGLLLAVVALPGIAWSQVELQAELPGEEEVEEVRRYTVEMIVFEYADSAVSGDEIFQPDELPEGEVLLMPPRSFGDPGTTVDADLPVLGLDRKVGPVDPDIAGVVDPGLGQRFGQG